MASKKAVRATTRRAQKVKQLDANPDGTFTEWPRPVQDGEWADPEGVHWRMRGGPLKPKAARKAVRDSTIPVGWAYELSVRILTVEERADLVSRLETFFDGDAPPYSHFDLGDFRDRDHQRLLIVEESC